MKFVLNEKKRNTHKHELFELLLSFFAEFLIYHLAELANDFNLSFLSLLTAKHGERPFLISRVAIWFSFRKRAASIRRCLYLKKNKKLATHF